MKILIIEDQASELKLAHQVLAAAGHEVSGLAAADEAFDAIRQDSPDLIVLDMALPGMDGLALVRMLKADKTTQGIIVVAVTSYPERYSKTLVLDAGCDAYIIKPLSTRTLSSDLHELAMSRGKPPSP